MAEEIIKDISILQDVSNMEDCNDLEEGKKLAQEMFKALASQRTCPAISANQIGINKRIIVLNLREPVYLINPIIVKSSMPAPHVESHASFPQKLFTTIRSASVTVKANNIDGEFTFGLKPGQRKLLYNKNRINTAVTTHPIVMEAAYVQQTIDTLNGIMPMERVLQSVETIKKTSNTIHRNEVVTLEKDGETMRIKYKRAEKFIQDGWKVKN